MTQVLVVSKEAQGASVATVEQAKRYALTKPGVYDFFELRFGPRSSKPTLKKMTVKIVEKKRPEINMFNEAGEEITR